MPPLPLEGLRIIDLSVVWAGPFTSALLSDLGAEVIRVESLQRWDQTTRMMTPLAKDLIAHTPDAAADAPQWEVSGNHNSVNRSKKSVTMDLTRPEGRDAFYRLVRVADFFVENNGPNVVAHLGADYATLSAINPKLIMISMAGFGANGPYHGFRAFGANMEAIVGHALLRGYSDSDPTTNSNVFFADACGGATGAFALLAALHHRNRTGRGQFIDMSQAENVTHTFSQAVMDYSMNRRETPRYGNRDLSHAPQGVYRCAGDDSWLTISVGSDSEFEALCDVIGRPELIDDERYSDALSRYRHQDELDAVISAWSATQDHYEAFHTLQKAGVPAAPVLDFPELANDPQLRTRGMLQSVTNPVAGTHEHMKSPISHMPETPLQYWRHAPNLGQDNEYVYRELLGYSAQEYQWFIDNQHAGTRYVGM